LDETSSPLLAEALHIPLFIDSQKAIAIVLYYISIGPILPLAPGRPSANEKIKGGKNDHSYLNDHFYLQEKLAHFRDPAIFSA
jgi:hypothetical protein